VWFDKVLLSEVEGLTTNEIHRLPFVRSTGSRRSLILSKDLFNVPLTRTDSPWLLQRDSRKITTYFAYFADETPLKTQI